MQWTNQHSKQIHVAGEKRGKICVATISLPGLTLSAGEIYGLFSALRFTSSDFSEFLFVSLVLRGSTFNIYNFFLTNSESVLST